MLDAEKVLPVLGLAHLDRSALTDQDLHLMMELKATTDALLARKLLHGYWDSVTDVRGALPDAREGSTMAMVGETVYVFGGFSRIIYNDTRAYNQDTNTWRIVKYDPSKRVPDKR